MIKIRMDDFVKVKLTHEGRLVMKTNHYLFSARNMIKEYEFKERAVDENGYSDFLLFELFSQFGWCIKQGEYICFEEPLFVKYELDKEDDGILGLRVARNCPPMPDVLPPKQYIDNFDTNLIPRFIIEEQDDSGGGNPYNSFKVYVLYDMKRSKKRICQIQDKQYAMDILKLLNERPKHTPIGGIL